MSRSAITTRMRSRPEREPARGNVLAGEHADQPVVAAAAAEAAGEIRHRDLHDRAGVVRQPARQAGVEPQVRGRARRRAKRKISARFATAACPAADRRQTMRRARDARRSLPLDPP